MKSKQSEKEQISIKKIHKSQCKIHKVDYTPK